ncbi:1,4-alpha-glucan branching protein GlgB [Dongia sp.]|uniref:1,4-alpha-glucan branching protein GlgB n=1 Tax=Dongia sp. TaxID=1977262 RepID=UPI003752845F
MSRTTHDVAPDPGALEALLRGRLGDPFSLLGPHRGRHGTVIRTFQPGAKAVEVHPLQKDEATETLQPLHPSGVFGGEVIDPGRYVLRVQWPETVQETEDPYSFGTLLGDVDLHLISEGTHRNLGATLGAQVMEQGGVAGVRFAVWAPNARRVSVVGDFNNWDGRRHGMRLRHSAGVWELFIPRLRPGTIYKYEIVAPSGEVLPLKADPVALRAEVPPATASMVADLALISWTDGDWEAGRAERQTAQAPMSIYEVHAGSWFRENGVEPTWNDLTERLIPYVKEMGFTHIELLPVMEHPFTGSWGYQPIGLFAPTSRYGSCEDFARFVDACHRAEIGVILDWVPAHFPSDAHGLATLDGTHLYEHQDPREGFHHDWNTLIFNFGRREVRGYLIASALHWLRHYHIDALRVDAVASMLYRDYSRKQGEWVPNVHGGRENLEAVSFLQELSQIMRQDFPGRLLIAEESTAWPGVTRSADEGGLGFQFKWNMGWMNDTLRYMSRDPAYRSWHHDDMTFGLIYAFSERFILPLSHDEVVHGKRSILGRMPGDDWQRFANMRAYLAFMWSHPGKKLIFMGTEIAEPFEWNHDAQVNWWLLDHAPHSGMQRLVRDLNRLYASEPALHRRDAEPAGFRWIVGDDRGQSVLAYLRSAGEDDGKPVLAVCNFTPVPHRGYRIGVPHGGRWRERLNSDAGIYGGSNLGNGGGISAETNPVHGFDHSLSLTLPPLATVWLQPE